MNNQLEVYYKNNPLLAKYLGNELNVIKDEEAQFIMSFDEDDPTSRFLITLKQINIDRHSWTVYRNKELKALSTRKKDRYVLVEDLNNPGKLIEVLDLKMYFVCFFFFESLFRVKSYDVSFVLRGLNLETIIRTFSLVYPNCTLPRPISKTFSKEIKYLISHELAAIRQLLTNYICLETKDRVIRGTSSFYIDSEYSISSHLNFLNFSGSSKEDVALNAIHNLRLVSYKLAFLLQIKMVSLQEFKQKLKNITLISKKFINRNLLLFHLSEPIEDFEWFIKLVGERNLKKAVNFVANNVN